jgi:hypothetical protein
MGSIPCVNGRQWCMEISEKRIIGSLILLLGLSFLLIGVYSGQLASISEFVKSVFQPAVAGMP